MERFIGYLRNGKGYGLKYLFLFSVLVVILSYVMYHKSFQFMWEQTSMEEVLTQVPVLTFKDHQLLALDKPFKEDLLGMEAPFYLVIDPSLDQQKISDESDGLYLTKNDVWVHLNGQMMSVGTYQNIPNMIVTGPDLLKFVQQGFQTILIFFAFLSAFLIWFGYAFLLLMTLFFGFLIGFKCPISGLISRLAVVSWSFFFTLFMGMILLLNQPLSLTWTFGFSLAFNLIVLMALQNKLNKADLQTPSYVSILPEVTSSVTEPVQEEKDLRQEQKSEQLKTEASAVLKQPTKTPLKRKVQSHRSQKKTSTTPLKEKQGASKKKGKPRKAS